MSPTHGSQLTITNPLVLYRSLVATNRIRPDPAQHRLAIHLQKLYERLIDYEPSTEYSDRLKQLSRAVAASQDVPSQPDVGQPSIGTRGIWTSLLAQKERRDSLALTRVLTSHESALQLQSPKGLMLHGEVGTGKSMLIDLFADCLPNQKKRRWHFNTFMLDTFSRLEYLRKRRAALPHGAAGDEYSLLWLARDLIQTSPILFLDEFQLPDRTASKILSNLMTSFFQLGGVLVATSNRMPEELAKAAGIEFARPVSRLSRLGWTLGMTGVAGRDDGPGQKGEFAQFLEVLRARCEVWEMEGKKDYRRLSVVKKESMSTQKAETVTMPTAGATRIEDDAAIEEESLLAESTSLPEHYFLTSTADHAKKFDEYLHTLTSTPPSHPLPWTSATLTVYGRSLLVATQNAGIALFTFFELCGTALGPADYITLASTYHTLILTDIPILTLLQKNEARRLITLLDALYEARCCLLITAAARPDDLFFPTTAPTTTTSSPEDASLVTDDAVHPETYAEIHQDLTSPFRPNISPYLSADALEDDPPNRLRRPGSSYTDERRTQAQVPDFAAIGGLTGEDEKFAVKRAQSRMWEMTSARWWERATVSATASAVEVHGDGEQQTGTGWWRPLPLEARHWEGRRPLDAVSAAHAKRAHEQVEKSDVQREVDKGEHKADMFAHGASPFRTTSDPPPKIESTHVWGTMRWGKRAGAWGKGVEGLRDRRIGK